MIARPRKVYDFTAHARRQPNAPPPGDRIDAQLDNHADAIAAAQIAIEQLIAAQAKPIDVEGPAKRALAGIQILADDIKRASGDAQALVDQASLQLKRVWAEADRARDAADRAEARLSAAVLAAQAAPASHAGVVPYAGAMPVALLGPNTGGFYAGDDAGATATSAVLRSSFASSGPNTCPTPSRRIFWRSIAISGDHWSSRWWANRSANAFGMLAWWYQGAWP